MVQSPRLLTDVFNQAYRMKMASFRFKQKVKYFLGSLLSRYLPRLVLTYGVVVKVPAEVKAIRRLSCHGDDTLAPCPSRLPSQNFENSYFCEACQCGDRKGTLLGGDTPQYEKLDYPFLACPLNMPGFSTYVPSPDEEETNERKVVLEARYGVQPLSEMASSQRRRMKPQHFLARLQGIAQQGGRNQNTGAPSSSR